MQFIKHKQVTIINPLRTKLYLSDLKIQSVQRSKHTPSQLYKAVG